MDNSRKIFHAHDRFARKALSYPRVAQDFFAAHLPPDILKAIDLSDLKLQSQSYIDDEHKEFIADLLFKTKLSNHPAYLYLLVEHQSTPDRLMPYRTLKNSIGAIENDLKSSNNKKIPLVYSIVIYHGQQSYPYSTDIKDLVDAPMELVEKYFLKPFHLVDLGSIADEEIKQHAWASVLEFALKHTRARDIMNELKKISELLCQIIHFGGEEYVGDVLLYMFNRAEGDQKVFVRYVSTNISKKIGIKIMTMAEQCIAEGVHQGLHQGAKQKGFEIAKRLLNEKFELRFIANMTELSIEELEELKKEMVA